jgi:alpha-D-ribose 1-methylphosphonate 5-phosphate C-P lyase
MINKVCKYCDSENVWKDALVEWDKDKQEWITEEINDSDYCRDCDGETTIIDKEIEKFKYGKIN